MPPVLPTALVLGGAAALVQASLKAMDGAFATHLRDTEEGLGTTHTPSWIPPRNQQPQHSTQPNHTAKEAAMSVPEAAGPFVAAAFVLCLLGVLAGAGGLKPTHLSEDPAYR